MVQAGSQLNVINMKVLYEKCDMILFCVPKLHQACMHVFYCFVNGKLMLNNTYHMVTSS